MGINLGAGVGIPAKFANRHGLIAGATGTGKTVTLQTMCEQFSSCGVPVFVADVKGDISGLAVSDHCGTYPVRFWDVAGHKGRPLTMALWQLGPDLLARLLELTDAQTGAIEQAFAHNPRLSGLDSLSKAVRGQDTGAATKAAIERGILRLKRQGGDSLFSGPFDVSALWDADSQGRGMMNVLDAQQLIRSPLIYSTLLIWLLDQFYERLPESGDMDVPHFAFFLDEAHLLFEDASPTLIQKISRTVRLIRSKGVGVYFVTQSPEDLPSDVLGQLGNRIQHRLSAATLRDQKAIRAAAETMPVNPRIDAAEAIGKLATGEALVSTIGSDGAPTQCQRVRIGLPRCRLGAISDIERKQLMLLDGYDPANRVTVAPVAESEPWGMHVGALLVLACFILPPFLF